MKLALTFLFLLIAYVNCLYVDPNEFQNFKSRDSDDDISVSTFRDLVVQSQLKYIEDHNSQPLSQRSFELGPNRMFLGKTLQELKQSFFIHLPSIAINGVLHNTKLSKKQSQETIKVQAIYLVDHVAAGKVPPMPPSQGNCGSCYSFSAAYTMANVHYLKYNTMMVMSKQLGLDCGVPYGNYGCGGGYPHQVFQLYKQRGYTSQANYPYQLETAKNQRIFPCNNSKFASGFKIVRWQGYINNPELALTTLGSRVLSVTASAGNYNFMYYRSGILNFCSIPLVIDHAVNMVGLKYSVETSEYIVVIANSWGPSWGENGYARVSLKNGACGTLYYYAAPFL